MSQTVKEQRGHMHVYLYWNSFQMLNQWLCTALKMYQRRSVIFSYGKVSATYCWTQIKQSGPFYPCSGLFFICYHAAMSFSAYGLESSRIPSYVSSTFGAVKVSSGPVTAQDSAQDNVTKMETKAIEEQVAQASEEKQEQKLVEAEAVAEE